jgi:hypothetical protein
MMNMVFAEEKVAGYYSEGASLVKDSRTDPLHGSPAVPEREGLAL